MAVGDWTLPPRPIPSVLQPFDPKVFEKELHKPVAVLSSMKLMSTSATSLSSVSWPPG